jgi:acyl-CoA synthetase (NDP forming)
MVAAGMEVFDQTGIPLITSVQSAARAIACLYRYRRYRERLR